jgi:hypothetical protein
VPTELSSDAAAQFELLPVELLPVDGPAVEAPVAYVATGRGNEIVDVVFALASVAWKPLRRGQKPKPPPLN